MFKLSNGDNLKLKESLVLLFSTTNGKVEGK